MADLGSFHDRLPVAAPLFKQFADFDVEAVLWHGSDILGKFSLKHKEHFTKGLGHPDAMKEGGTINRVLARNLAYWMGEARLTQAALAEKAGVSQKTISNYLNPDQRVEGSKGKEPSAKLTELNNIAAALGVDLWQLLREMSESERLMYAAIEDAYIRLVHSAQTSATEHGTAPAPEDVELFNAARTTGNVKKTKKRRAA
jgi:transcriptional regulator with XRE-family HTH domain